jgi:hypothetical protein
MVYEPRINHQTSHITVDNADAYNLLQHRTSHQALGNALDSEYDKISNVKQFVHDRYNMSGRRVFIFYLYLSDDTFSVTRTTQRRMKGSQVNDEFKRMLKEVVVA